MAYPGQQYDPGWNWNTSFELDFMTAAAFVTAPRYPSVNGPRKHIMHCKSCGTSAMIPDSTDKIVALVCPQCGGVLSD